MNWTQFKDPLSYLCFHGTVVLGSRIILFTKIFHKLCRLYRIHLGKTRMYLKTCHTRTRKECQFSVGAYPCRTWIVNGSSSFTCGSCLPFASWSSTSKSSEQNHHFFSKQLLIFKCLRQLGLIREKFFMRWLHLCNSFCMTIFWYLNLNRIHFNIYVELYHATPLG